MSPTSRSVSLLAFTALLLLCRCGHGGPATPQNNPGHNAQATALLSQAQTLRVVVRDRTAAGDINSDLDHHTHQATSTAELAQFIGDALEADLSQRYNLHKATAGQRPDIQIEVIAKYLGWGEAPFEDREVYETFLNLRLECTFRIHSLKEPATLWKAELENLVPFESRRVRAEHVDGSGNISADTAKKRLLALPTADVRKVALDLTHRISIDLIRELRTSLEKSTP